MEERLSKHILCTMHILITIDYPIGTAFGLIVIFCLSLIIQRLYFHPLSCFPGPPLAATTTLYRTYFEVFKGGEFLREIVKLHSQYGPVIRIGPNELHFNDYRAHAEIYSVGSQFSKDPSFYHCFGVNGSVFGAIDPRVSKVRRAFMNTFFSRRAMLKLEDVIKQKAGLLVSRLAESKEKPTNMFLAFRSATLDIITVHMFGYCANALDYPEFSAPLLLNIQIAIPLLWLIKSFPWVVPILFLLPAASRLHTYDQFQAFIDVRQNLLGWLDRVQLEAKARPFSCINEASICHQIFDPDAKRCHAYPSFDDVFEEVLSLLQAGSDTVGNTCTIGMYHILKHDVVRSRLVEELRLNWPNHDDPIDLSVLQSLPYLTAVIKEALRLSHGFVTPLPRIVGPTGVYIAGHFIPPRTTVGISVTFIHLNPILFPNPHDFIPDRWLQPSSNSLNKYLLSFSSGPRMCLGISMAWAELYTFFAYIFRRLDVRIVDSELSDFNNFKDYFVPIYNGGQLHIIGAEYA